MSAHASEQQESGGTHFRQCRGQLAVERTGLRRYNYFIRVAITSAEHDALMTMQEKAPVFIGVELPKVKRL